jgi:hypothetical protein
MHSKERRAFGRFAANSRFRWAVLAIVFLTAVIAWWNFSRESGESKPDERDIARDEKTKVDAGVVSSASVGRAEARDFATSAEKDAQSVELGWARGTGYALGNLIKDVLSRATYTADGKKHIDLSQIQSDWGKSRRTVPLEDASTPARLRAEYFAAILCGALDVPVSDQAALANIMEPIYKRDGVDEDDKSREQSRVALSNEARAALLARLPAETHERFREMTAVPAFSFHAASFGADSMTFKGMKASGHSTAIFTSSGAVQFEGRTVFKMSGK